MIIKKETKGDITIYHVDKDMDDEAAKKWMDRKLKPSDIKDIIREDADIYNAEGKLLARFRKNKLNRDNIDQFYENVIKFANQSTSNRGSASGSKKKDTAHNPKIKTNILGYFDRFSQRQHHIFTKKGLHVPKVSVRETRFLVEHPEQYKKLIPLIKEIDHYYKKYIPEQYALQKRKANQTPFRIADTAFTTVTTNVNYQTAVHTDRGDDAEGFGNLAVIEHGKFKGGETCFPQYGIGVDIRAGDVIYMDVHQQHGNLPIVPITKDAVRLSIVCYLRTRIWELTKGKTKKFMIKHNKTMRRILRGNK